MPLLPARNKSKHKQLSRSLWTPMKTTPQKAVGNWCLIDLDFQAKQNPRLSPRACCAPLTQSSITFISTPNPWPIRCNRLLVPHDFREYLQVNHHLVVPHERSGSKLVVLHPPFFPLTRWIEAQILGGLSSYKDGRSALTGREDDEHSVRNGGPKLRVIRDRRFRVRCRSIGRRCSVRPRSGVPGHPRRKAVANLRGAPRTVRI